MDGSNGIKGSSPRETFADSLIEKPCKDRGHGFMPYAIKSLMIFGMAHYESDGMLSTC